MYITHILLVLKYITITIYYYSLYFLMALILHTTVLIKLVNIVGILFSNAIQISRFARFKTRLDAVLVILFTVSEIRIARFRTGPTFAWKKIYIYTISWIRYSRRERVNLSDLRRRVFEVRLSSANFADHRIWIHLSGTILKEKEFYRWTILIYSELNARN